MGTFIFISLFSIAGLTETLFLLFLAGSLLLSRNKNKAAIFLGLATLCTGLHYLAVTTAMTVYHPFAAWHRFFSIVSLLFAVPFGTQFVLYFLAPVSVEKSRLGKIVLLAEAGIALLAIIFVFLTAIPPDPVFVNEAKLWTANIPTQAIVIAIILVIFSIVHFAICVYRYRIEQTSRKQILLVSILTICIMFTSLASNIILRLGLADYNITITFWFIVPFTFYVLMIIAYLNFTDIEISLIDKIIIGTLAMFVIAALTFSMVLDRSRIAQYEQNKDQTVLFMLTGSDYRPPDLMYHSIWNADRETLLYAIKGVTPGKVPPIEDARHHLVRPSINGREHYISFRKVYEGRVHEFGFSYRSFREYMAPSPGLVLFAVITQLLIIVFGSRLIYSYILTRPLQKITAALRKVEQGDLQVYIPVLTHDELGFLSHAINAMTGQIRDYTNYLEAMVDERTRELNEMNQNLVETTYKLAHAQRIAERDMKMAINIQRSLLPQTPPRSSDWDCAFHYQPMTGISGDAYDFYVREGKLAGAGIFDISGHGIASALIAVITRTIMSRSFAQMQRRKLGTIMQNANRQLIEAISSTDTYATGIMLKFDKNVAEYVNAAHPPLMLRKASTGKVHALRYRDGENSGGSFLGMQALEGPFASLRFQVETGDILLLFTDEFNEATNTDNEQYGLDRIMDALTRAPDDSARVMLDFLLEDFKQFTHPRTRPSDDLTILLLKRLPSENKSEA